MFICMIYGGAASSVIGDDSLLRTFVNETGMPSRMETTATVKQNFIIYGVSDETQNGFF